MIAIGSGVSVSSDEKVIVISSPFCASNEEKLLLDAMCTVWRIGLISKAVKCSTARYIGHNPLVHVHVVTVEIISLGSKDSFSDVVTAKESLVRVDKNHEATWSIYRVIVAG